MKNYINRHIFKILVAIASLLVFATQGLYSQNIDPLTGRPTGLYDQDSLALDTTLLGDKKVKRPFRSPLFADSVKTTRIFKWNIDLSTAGIKMIPVDTSLFSFEKNYPFMKNNMVGAASVGTLGGAAIPFVFADRYERYSNSFTNPYGDYLFTPENVPFYNTKSAFTQFEYLTAGQKQYAEEHLFINHAQNISPASSFNLTYQNNRKRGNYQNQQSINKNLSLNYAYTGRQYTLFMGYIYNMADIIENGGVKDITQIIDTTIDIESTIGVNILASNEIKGHQFYITQAVAIPLGGVKIDSTTNFSNIPTLSVGATYSYSAFRKVYQDKKTETGEYYDDWLLDKKFTRDSINEKNTDLKFFFKYQPYSSYGAIGVITGGIGYSNEKYYNFNQNDYFAPSKVDSKNNMYVYGQLTGGYYQYLNWKAYAKYYPFGYRSQDLDFGGTANLTFGKTKMPLRFEVGANMSVSTAPYWTQNYVSNHYKWHNSFGKEVKTEFDFTFKMDKINLEIGFTQSIETNKIYYGEDSKPKQFSGAVSVSSLFFRKDFKWKGLHLQHRANLQVSSNQSVVPVPLVAANVTYFYDLTVVKNVLNVHIGFDAYYNTEYYGFGYNPAIGQFYNQREVKVGNYPMLDLFVVGKWKRLRFLLKVQHLNFGWTDNLNYIQVANNPLNRMMLTFGFSWNFYD